MSPDLCKPNKALRTTLKAFLRTEEKKREKDRQAAALPPPSLPTPAASEPTAVETDSHLNGLTDNAVEKTEKLEESQISPVVEPNSKPATDVAPVVTAENNAREDVSSEAPEAVLTV